MSDWTDWLWLAWAVALVALEAIGYAARGRDGTLSALVQRWVGRSRIRGVVIFGAVTVIAAHLAGWLG